MKIPVRLFKGLYTNIDESDKNQEHFSVYDNIRTYPGYIKAQRLALTEQDGYLPQGHIFVYENIVFLDEDRYSNRFINNNTELSNNYVQNIKKYHFRITYFEGKYYFYTKEFGTDDWRPVYGTMSPFEDVAGQYPYVINENGVLKVLFKKKALWIGKINRTYWIMNDQYGENRSPMFQAYPLIEKYQNSQPSLFQYELLNASSSEFIDCYARVDSESYELSYLGALYDVVAVRFYRADDLYPINFGGANYLIFYKAKFSTDPKTYYILWEGYTPDMFTPSPGMNSVNMPEETKVLLANGQWEQPPFWREKFYLFGDIESVRLYMTGSTEPGIMGTVPFRIDIIKANITGEGIAFNSGRNIQILTTIVINNNEYPIAYDNLGSSTASEFTVKVTPRPEVILNSYKNKMSANIYFRYSSDTLESEEKDFELCYSINFISGKQDLFPKYIDSLTPNGIFLTQMIGKFFDPATYDIIDNPQDYITVGGVSYIIYGGNIHFPAIGGGNILNNIFYKENFVPGVEGQFLSQFGNNLGVFSKDREEFTMIDFQPVESSMIFYIKDTASYKIRDYYDMVETNEGTILNLKEGIMVTNGYDRTLISEQINDIVEKYYDESMILFNSSEKILFYLCPLGLYAYDFRTRVWNKYDFKSLRSIRRVIKTEQPINPDDLIVDYMEDYEGGFYFVTETKVYKVTFEDSTFTDRPARLLISLLDLGEMSYGKILNWVLTDSEGEVEVRLKDTREFTPISTRKSSNLRAMLYFNNLLKNRKPLNHLSVEVKFTGVINNIDLDVTPSPKVKK